MRSSLLLSTGLHAAIVAVGFFGLPLVQKPPPSLETPILVEFVEVGAKTNLPTRQEPKKEKPPEKKEAKKEEPKPEPPKPKPAPPKAAPPPAPAEEEIAALPPEPLPVAKPKPKPKAAETPKPKPKPKPAPKAKPKPPQKVAKAKPRRKPKPPDPFASVLKTLEDIKSSPPPKKKEAEVKKKAPKPKKPELSFEEQIAKAISREDKAFDPSRKLSVTYYQKLRASIMRQVQPCWIIPAGAKGAGGLAVEIRLQLAPDGNVLQSDVVNGARMLTDGFYRAAAESARRAVSRESRCTPFKLPRDDFEAWRDLIIVFDPREVIGR